MSQKDRPTISAKTVAALVSKTGAALQDCYEILTAFGGDFASAAEYLEIFGAGRVGLPKKEHVVVSKPKTKSSFDRALTSAGVLQTSDFKWIQH